MTILDDSVCEKKSFEELELDRREAAKALLAFAEAHERLESILSRHGRRH